MWRSSYWRLGALVATATAVVGLLAWWHFGKKPTVAYTTETVGRGAVTRTVTATGTVNPELTIIVGSYVSGVIQQLSCDYNTQVKAGQVCAKIDPRPYQATLDQYSGQLAARSGHPRQGPDRSRALSDSSRRRIRSRASRPRTKLYVVQQDEGTVKLDQALVESAKLNLGYTDIVSPVDGTVVSRNVTQGQTVAASFQTPTLFLIATDLTKMQVDTNVSESDIGGVKDGDKATFTVDAFPQARLRRHGHPGPPVAADGSERRDL